MLFFSLIEPIDTVSGVSTILSHLITESPCNHLFTQVQFFYIFIHLTIFTTLTLTYTYTRFPYMIFFHACFIEFSHSHRHLSLLHFRSELHFLPSNLYLRLHLLMFLIYLFLLLYRVFLSFYLLSYSEDMPYSMENCGSVIQQAYCNFHYIYLN